MSETADCTVRITPTAHQRLKDISRWSGGLSLAAVARLAIEDSWLKCKPPRKAGKRKAKSKARLTHRKDLIERKARRDGR